ncbi:NAD(P)/FAD-dependent oxidoreductase [Sphingomonas sp. RB1R13]|uniref:NAD(P)/FAD-dependent oxidoreductase n=1 Tax=Sphingomonas sp. RB1R13 TaxID=3096159 RepID=UPI002FC8D2E1
MENESNYYRATANGWVAQPALAGEASADLIVVGGGFTGMAAALSAAERGRRVVLVEAGQIGDGASGRNGGQLIPGLRWSAGELVAEFGIAQAKAIHAVAMMAVERVAARIERHGIACDYKSGHLEAAWRPAHLAAMAREADLLARDFGRDDLELVAPGEMERHIRTRLYHGGVYDRRGGHFHPLNYLIGLARAALAAGVVICEDSRVIELRQGGQVTVVTAGGSVIAPQAIVAADAWTDTLLPEARGMTVPIINYNIATAPLGVLADTLLPSDAAVADSRFVLNYFRLSADKRMIFGGGEKYRQTPPASIADFVRPHMAGVFPELADVPIDYGWGGVVSVTMNRLPHLGRERAIWFAHGFSGHGALLTTLAGELLAEAIDGDCADYDRLAALPHRRFPGGRHFAKPLATLGLLYYALKDRL